MSLFLSCSSLEGMVSDVHAPANNTNRAIQKMKFLMATMFDSGLENSGERLLMIVMCVPTQVGSSIYRAFIRHRLSGEMQEIPLRAMGEGLILSTHSRVIGKVGNGCRRLGNGNSFDVTISGKNVSYRVLRDGLCRGEIR